MQHTGDDLYATHAAATHCKPVTHTLHADYQLAVLISYISLGMQIDNDTCTGGVFWILLTAKNILERDWAAVGWCHVKL